MRIHQAIHGEEASAQNSKFQTLLRVHIRYNRVELKESEKHRMFFYDEVKCPQTRWVFSCLEYFMSYYI